MKGFVGDLDVLAKGNSHFRRVVFTGSNLQLVVMCLAPGEETGEEFQSGRDRFFRIEEGQGHVHIDGALTRIERGDSILVPAGARHNIVNEGSAVMRLYTIYSPPEHRQGTIHETRSDALGCARRFDDAAAEPGARAELPSGM